MRNRKGSTVVQLIFQKDRTESVDFEVAFTALLATGVFASTTRGSDGWAILYTAAGLLLLITVIRRMAVVGRFAREEFILKKSQIPIEFLGILCILQISVAITTFFLDTIGFESGGFSPALLAVIIGVLLYILVHQILFQNYLLFWGAYFYTFALSFKSNENIQAISESIDGSDVVSRALENFSNGEISLSVLYEIVLGWTASEACAQFAYFILRGNLPESDSDEIIELRDWVDSMNQRIEREDNSQPSISSIWLVLAILLLAMFSGPILLIGLLTGLLLPVMLAFVAIPMVGHIIQFLYLAFGTPTKRELRSLKWQIGGKTLYVAFSIAIFV